MADPESDECGMPLVCESNVLSSWHLRLSAIFELVIIRLWIVLCQCSGPLSRDIHFSRRRRTLDPNSARRSQARVLKELTYLIV